MPTEEPSFSSKPLTEINESENEPEKPVRKKRTAKPSAKSSEKSTKQTKISQQLTKIYQDTNGHLPDMKRIKMKKKNSGFKAFFVFLILAALMSAAAWAGFLLMPSGTKFSENQVVLNIEGPKTIIAGATTTYKISYENNQSLSLKKATLNIQYPEGFIFLSSDIASKNSGHTEWDLNEVGAHKKMELTITGLMYGSLNQKQSWRVFLKYKPENFGSELQKASILDVTIEKSPFSLTINGPGKTIAGNTAEYTFTVKKEFDSQATKLELKPSWPQNFFITSSSVVLNKDRKWIIDLNKTTSPTSSGTWVFKITGKFSSAPTGTNATVNLNDISGVLSTITNNTAFALANAKATTELTQNDLDFNLAINGSLTNFNTQPGDKLNITISLKNLSPNDLKSASLKLTLDAPSAKKQSLLDWAKIEDKFDGDVRGIQISDTVRRGEIVWGKNKIPELAKINKGQELSLDIALPIKDNSAFNLSDLKTFQITVLADITFKDADGVSHTLSGNQIIITLNSDLKFEARDSVSGDKKTHQLSWILTNNFHPLKNLVLSADVYGSDTKVEPASSSPAGEVKFDQTTKKITWTIPEMPEGVDVLAMPITITLKSINPTQKLLISKTHVQAEDTVTGEKLDFMGEEIGLNR